VIVVDTNLIAYLLLGGEKTANARSIYKRDAKWAAPILWRSEFRSVLAMFIRQRKLTSDKAIEFMNEAEILMQGEEYQVDSRRIIKLIDTSKCSAYDSEFIALAQHLAVPLVTSDKQILIEFPDTAVSIESYSA
jgi:predicted nucleic acid-binding protein